MQALDALHSLTASGPVWQGLNPSLILIEAGASSSSHTHLQVPLRRFLGALGGGCQPGVQVCALASAWPLAPGPGRLCQGQAVCLQHTMVTPCWLPVLAAGLSTPDQSATGLFP